MESTWKRLPILIFIDYPADIAGDHSTETVTTISSIWTHEDSTPEEDRF